MVTDETGENEGIFALKKLMNMDRVDRFKEEIKAGIELKHSNIIDIIDFDYNEGPFIVMEHYKEGNLKNIKNKDYSIEDKLKIFRRLCDAVAYAHKNNVIHRDLKPENILLKNDFEPVIADFGLCHFTDSGERITLTEEAVGSRFYMAPELEDGKIDKISPASDVSALGKILYWLITGNIFSREKLHEDEYDITKYKRYSKYFLINEFLDKMIIADPNERLENGCVVLDELDILIRRIDRGSNCIGLGIPQNCIYCGLGQYKRLPKTYDIGASVVLNFFNFIDDDQWTIFQCDYCNNLKYLDRC